MSVSSVTNDARNSQELLEFAKIKPESKLFGEAEARFKGEECDIKGRSFKHLIEADFRCELLMADDKVRGILIYQDKLESECPLDNISQLFKIVFLSGDLPAYSSQIIERAIILSKRKDAQGVHLSLPASAKELSELFLKKQFKTVNTSIPNKLHLCLKHKNGFEQLQDDAASCPPTVINKKRERSTTDSTPPQDQKRRRVEERPQLHRSSSFSVPRNAATLSGPLQQLTLKKKYIHQIRNSAKTVEGRIYNGCVLRYRAGDRIRFFYHADQSDDVICKIIKIERYKSFGEMLGKVGFKKCLADVYSLNEAISVYDAIPGYPQRAQQHGVAAIYLEKEQR